MDYTINYNTILQYARQEAERLGNTEVLPEHLILGVLRLGDGMAFQYLVRLGINPSEFKSVLDQHASLTGKPGTTSSSVPYSRSVERVLRLSAIEAENYESDSIGSAHLLLAVLHERINYPATYLEQMYGITYERVEQLYPKPNTTASAADYDLENDGDEGGLSGLFSQLTGGVFTSEKTKKSSDKSSTPALDKYSRDLTQMAEKGLLDPVVGRDCEIQRVTQILARRKKNNPILIGEPGVGKSAIVEALAQQIVRGESPLAGHRIVSLEMASIVAGTTYRGQFEQRMKELVTEIRNHPEIILFIDEIHTIIGAGNAQGSLDAANILKPALARGEMQCIGATTTAEYRNSIEKDGALERRFQKVLVVPTQHQEALAIIQRLSQHYGDFHRVQYSDEALEACVTLSERYISDRALPDKAIDAMDEAGARKSIAKHNPETKPVVTADDIASVISMMSGVPVQRVAKRENEQLLLMDDVLRHQIIGQDEAINKVVRAIRRSRLGLRDTHRPIGTFFFLGSTGVGKTYLAQCLAQQMFGSRDAVIRLDMSEYMEKHSVSLLVGAPPGYIAHEDGGKLTEAVRRKPYSIVLFDEIEKAHPDIFNVLLQVLDEGRLTDRQGHSVDFRNTIIILTSNVGTRQLRDFGAGIGFGAGEINPSVAQQTLTKALNHTFPPEFINRIDDLIFFAPLKREHIIQILDIEIGNLRQRLHETGRTLVLSQQARTQLLDKAFDPQNGARPVKRAVQTYLEDKITEILLKTPETKRITIHQI